MGSSGQKSQGMRSCSYCSSLFLGAGERALAKWLNPCDRASEQFERQCCGQLRHPFLLPASGWGGLPGRHSPATAATQPLEASLTGHCSSLIKLSRRMLDILYCQGRHAQQGQLSHTAVTRIRNCPWNESRPTPRPSCSIVAVSNFLFLHFALALRAQVTKASLRGGDRAWAGGGLLPWNLVNMQQTHKQ